MDVIVGRVVSKKYTVDIKRRSFPHIQARTKTSNAMVSSNFIYKISKNQFIRMNINVENNDLFERPCVIIVRDF